MELMEICKGAQEAGIGRVVTGSGSDWPGLCGIGTWWLCRYDEKMIQYLMGQLGRGRVELLEGGGGRDDWVGRGREPCDVLFGRFK